MARDESRDERPQVWVGHVTMATDRLVESNQFMVALGLRPIVLTENVAVLELRGGTHLVLLPTENPPKGRAPFDLMVEDLDAIHRELAAKGLEPSAVESGQIHSSFTVTDPSGQDVLFNSSHVGDLPV